MAQLLVRNLTDETVAELKRRASEHGRSVEAEHRAILEQALKAERVARVQEWLKEADALRERFKGRTFTPSEVLIRESRDER